MDSRPTLSRSVAFITLATLAYTGLFHASIPSVHSQEVASDASGASTPSIHDKIEVAQIRLAIRLQEVQIAKAERRLLVPGADGAAEVIKAKEQELLVAEKELSQLKGLQEQGLVTMARIQEAEAKRLATVAQIAGYRSNSAAWADKIAVHDEKTKLLELRADLAKARLDQLKRHLKK